MFVGVFILSVIFALGAEVAANGKIREERDVWEGGHGYGRGFDRRYPGGRFHGPPGHGRHGGFYPPRMPGPYGGFGKQHGGNFPQQQLGPGSAVSANAESLAGGGGAGGNSGASATAGGIGGASNSQAKSQTATFEFGPLTATFTNNQASASSVA